MRNPSVLLAATPREIDMFLGKGVALPGAPRIFDKTEKLPQAGWRELLEDARPEVLVSCWSTPKLPTDWLHSPDCPLRYVCHLTGSVRGVVPREFIEKGGLVTNWGSCAAPQVAEHALLLLLSALRDTTRWADFQPTTKLYTTRTLFGRKVGVHGFGKIARRFIELIRPFGVEVRVYSHGVPHELITSHGAKPCQSLLEMAQNSELLVDCEALTEESYASVSREVLAALPDDAVFVNVGRGKVVDEQALLAEARAGRLRVAVDVVAIEPVLPDSPWATLPHLIHSPHIAGPTGDTLQQCGHHAAANIQRYLRGEAPDSRISLEIYDRST